MKRMAFLFAVALFLGVTAPSVAQTFSDWEREELLEAGRTRFVYVLDDMIGPETQTHLTEALRKIRNETGVNAALFAIGKRRPTIEMERPMRYCRAAVCVFPSPKPEEGRYHVRVVRRILPKSEGEKESLGWVFMDDFIARDEEALIGYVEETFGAYWSFDDY